MSDSLNKYCSEAKDFKDVKDAMNKIQKLRAQMKNPTRDGMIETSLDKGTQRKTTENELPSLTQCTA